MAERRGDRHVNRTRVVGVSAAVVAVAAILLSGYGTSSRSSCATPSSPPTTLSGNERRDPVVASDGGGGIVAIWESLTGGPVEASAHTPTGTWSAPAPLSGPYARFPSVAVSPTGEAVAAWQMPESAKTTAVQVTTRDTNGAWSPPFDVSPPRQHAREPQIAFAGNGTALLVWRRDTTGNDTVIEVTERPLGGQWTTPQPLSDPSVRSKRPRLAVAPNGAAALVWEQTVDGRLTVVAATRAADGRWSAPLTLSGTARGHEPDVAIGPTGTATAVWIDEGENAATVMASSHSEGGTWSTPVVIGRGSALPHETPRPGRADTGADVAVLPGGRIAAVWTIVADGTNRAQIAATQPDGTWAGATALSKPGAAASGVQVTALAGGGVAAGWEELDGGLIRAHVARLPPDGSPPRCTALTAAVAESGAVRLAGGSAPTAVFVDFNRSRVQAAPIP